MLAMAKLRVPVTIGRRARYIPVRTDRFDEGTKVTIDPGSAYESIWWHLVEATVRKADAVDILAEFAEAIGMRYISYETYSTRPDHPKGLVLNNLPAKHCANYNENAQYEFDPIVLAYKTNMLPFRTGHSTQIRQLRGLDQYIFAEARGYGIGEALCVPIRAVDGQFAMFAVVCEDDIAVPVDPGTPIFNAVVALAPYVHAYWMSRREAAGNLPQSAPLRDVEKVCLHWTGQGKTSWEIAGIIGRSQSTVEGHLVRAMHKLNTVNKAHALATAMRQGLI